MRNFIAMLLLSAFTVWLPAGATTIAFDGKTMASDSQITQDQNKSFTGIKLIRVNGWVIGCAGDCQDIEEFKLWLKDQTKDKPKLHEFEALVWTPEGCFEYDDDVKRLPVKAPCAIGSGKCVAIGAMAAGVSAKRAVEVARDLDLYTGGPVQTMELK